MEPPHQVQGDEYQLHCALVSSQVCCLLQRLHVQLNGHAGSEEADGAAILIGAIGGALRFAIEADDATIRRIVTATVDTMLPQMRAQKQLRDTGTVGRA